MADTTTGLHVKSLAGEWVRSKLVDTAGTNEAAVSAAGRISVDGSGVTQPVSGTVAVSSITTSIVPGTAATNLGKAQGAAYAADDVGVMSLGVRNDAGTVLTGSADQDYVPLTTDATGALRVTGGTTNTQYVGDVAATATPTTTMASGLANAAAPTNVSADNDAVAMWMLRNGSPVMNIASGGTLVTVGQKAMASSLPVVLSSDQASIPVTVSSAAVAGTTAHDAAAAAINPVLVGAYASAAAPTAVSADGDAVDLWALRNGSAVVNLASGGTLITVGQKTMANAFSVSIASDQTVIPVSDNAASLTVDAPVATPVYVRLSDGAANLIGQKTMAASIPVVIASDQTDFVNTEYVGDAAATATPTGAIAMALANAAAPSDVSANNDAVALWALRNGSLVVNLAAGGTLWTNMGQAAASGQFVRINDGTTTAGVIVGTTALKTDLSSIAGTAPGATSFVPSRLTDGTAYYTNTGQAAGTSQFVRINDGTTTAGVIVGTTSLKTDAASIAGAVPSATNPLPVRLTDGAAFYAAASGAPTDPKFSTQTSAALGAGASATVTHYVTSGKTGQLMGVDVASTVPMKVVINTVVTASATARVVLFTLAAAPIMWRTPAKTFITRASADASSGFSVTITNKDATVAADVYSTAFWDEV